ncbi:MAG: cobyrinate a,c-diamide synthase [Rhodobacterales bacterium]|nr:cobyrinate a,c-diamide synthase [Rhodobacterales bacterium]
MARFLIAAAHKSSGKTVISTGLASALTARGDVVQCFKKGPDYIDPMWLHAASGRPCYNLDFNTMSPIEFSALACAKASDADIAMIEANKGLYDGVAVDGSDSNAALAKALKTPVILVIDCNGMTRGIAPLLIGYLAFDPDVNIAGVILNKVGGPRHEGKLRAAIAAYTDLPVIGAVPRNSALDLGERHLGLTTPSETDELTTRIAKIGEIVGASVDLDMLFKIAETAPTVTPAALPTSNPKFAGLRIAIARDPAFGFYYPDDLDAFTDLGATLIPFNAFTDTHLPDADAVFIGGGFPETQMGALSANQNLRDDIRTKLQSDLPAYAECGGLMYLCRAMIWDGTSHPMCGVVQGDAVMNARPQGRGYVAYTATDAHPWAAPHPSKAHEFHYARIDNLGDDTVFARKMTRGSGINGTHDGVVVHNVVAGFCHQRNTVDNPWVARFLQFVQDVKTSG